MQGEDAGRSASPLTEGLGQAAPERAEVARLDDGEAWSFCRTVISDGRDIRQWHPDEGYEMQSARMDAQAARRGDQLMAMVRALVAAERERCAQVADEHAKRSFPWGSENSDIYHAQADWAAAIAKSIRQLKA